MHIDDGIVTNSVKLIEKKERKVDLYCIAPIVSTTRPLSAQVWITQSYLQIHHICLSFVRAFARGRFSVQDPHVRK